MHGWDPFSVLVSFWKKANLLHFFLNGEWQFPSFQAWELPIPHCQRFLRCAWPSAIPLGPQCCVVPGFSFCRGGRWYIGSLQPCCLRSWHCVSSGNLAYCKPFLINKILWWKRNLQGYIRKKKTEHKCTYFLKWLTAQSLFLLLILPTSRHFFKEYYMKAVCCKMLHTA